MWLPQHAIIRDKELYLNGSIGGCRLCSARSRGIPTEKIFVAGFSQGGALSLFTGLSRPYRLGGVVCMSGYLPFARTFSPSPAASGGAERRVCSGICGVSIGCM
ncbi:Lypla2 [Symbiodinium microadriaticum]|nr:Lypla2 [Symbiodinium microadriaticum]